MCQVEVVVVCRELSLRCRCICLCCYVCCYAGVVCRGVFAVIPDEYNDLIGSQGVPSTIIMDGGGASAYVSGGPVVCISPTAWSI